MNHWHHVHYQSNQVNNTFAFCKIIIDAKLIPSGAVWHIKTGFCFQRLVDGLFLSIWYREWAPIYLDKYNATILINNKLYTSKVAIFKWTFKRLYILQATVRGCEFRPTNSVLYIIIWISALFNFSCHCFRDFSSLRLKTVTHLSGFYGFSLLENNFLFIFLENLIGKTLFLKLWSATDIYFHRS